MMMTMMTAMEMRTTGDDDTDDGDNDDDVDSFFRLKLSSVLSSNKKHF